MCNGLYAFAYALCSATFNAFYALLSSHMTAKDDDDDDDDNKTDIMAHVLPGCVSSSVELSVWYFLPPSASKDAVQTANVKCLKGLDVSLVDGPCFTAVQHN